MRLFKIFKPPGKWNFPVILLLGTFCGLGIYVLYLSKAHSYLSDKPETCVNCHVMAPQYATWNHSSHREWATCNDCHVPHDNEFNKYYFKAKDGLYHATMFTLRKEPQVIQIKEAGKKVVHDNCVRCHTQQVTDPKLAATVKNHHENMEGRVCWECHREVPHGRVNSLSSVPNARVPLLTSPVPDWIKKLTKE